MLEYRYKEKRTLVDFRRGPLGPHFNGFAAYLKAKGYSRVRLGRGRFAAYADSGISGESTPSQADINITRDLIRAGQFLKIEVLDHVIIGNPNHSSLRSMGYLF
jgi:hypothetical protein